jgi:hypothetical protein
MEKVIGIYQGIFTLSLMFVAAASFICISLLGYCTEDWLPRNVAIGCVAEVILFICSVNTIKKGSLEILKEYHSVRLLKELYVRIFFLMGFGITLSFILLFFPCGLISPEGEYYTSILIYALNIMVPALIIFIWMGVEIRKINNQMV